MELTPNMTRLLKLLVEQCDKPLEGMTIFLHVWEDYDKEYNPRSVRNLISNLRKRIPCLPIENHYGGRYLLHKYRESVPDIGEYVMEILDQAKNGVVITDPNMPDNPLVFVNEAFCTMFGYMPEEVLGRNCRFLQGNERDQPGLTELRRAIIERRDVTVTLRNYTKIGELIYSEVTISPIFDKKSDKLKYFLGI
ncbi:MAG: PAS domain-containing protein [Campylobacterales bacterium]|nr:PAS domain-containing protein [Campylobacterales bacterium]